MEKNGKYEINGKRYRIEDRLGGGATSQVYSAIDSQAMRVAIKHLEIRFKSRDFDEQIIQHFQSEHETLTRLQETFTEVVSKRPAFVDGYGSIPDQDQRLPQKQWQLSNYFNTVYPRDNADTELLVEKEKFYFDERDAHKFAPYFPVPYDHSDKDIVMELCGIPPLRLEERVKIDFSNETRDHVYPYLMTTPLFNEVVWALDLFGTSPDTWRDDRKAGVLRARLEEWSAENFKFERVRNILFHYAERADAMQIAEKAKIYSPDAWHTLSKRQMLIKYGHLKIVDWGVLGNEEEVAEIHLRFWRDLYFAFLGSFIDSIKRLGSVGRTDTPEAPISQIYRDYVKPRLPPQLCEIMDQCPVPVEELFPGNWITGWEDKRSDDLNVKGITRKYLGVKINDLDLLVRKLWVIASSREGDYPNNLFSKDDLK